MRKVTQPIKSIIQDELIEDEEKNHLMEQLHQLQVIRKRKKDRAQAEISKARGKLNALLETHQQAEKRAFEVKKASLVQLMDLTEAHTQQPLKQTALSDWIATEQQILNQVHEKQANAQQLEKMIADLRSQISQLENEHKTAEQKHQRLDMMIDYVDEEYR